MRKPANMTIDVIIPAYNEEESIVHVLKDMPMDLVREVVVVNNNSSDKTAEVAKSNGATVVNQPEQGYGNACLAGIAYVKAKTDHPDIVVFIDADYSDHPEEMYDLVAPINNKAADMVIGSRALGSRQKGSMMPQQRFGNWLATRMIRIIYRHRYTDLGPFRAVSYKGLIGMKMQDKTYGWTVEMQVKALKQKLSVVEIPVSYRKRIGVSKITGTIKGTILAGYKIISTILKYSFRRI